MTKGHTNNHKISTVSHENGLTSTWTRDAAGQATSFLTTNSSSAVISGVSHGYDNASRRTWASYEDSLGQVYACLY